MTLVSDDIVRCSSDELMALAGMSRLLTPLGRDYYCDWLAYRDYLARFEELSYGLQRIDESRLTRQPSGEGPQVFAGLHFGENFKVGMMAVGRSLRESGDWPQSRPLGVVVAPESIDQRMASHPDFVVLEGMRQELNFSYLRTGSPTLGREMLSILRKSGAIFVVLDGMRGESSLIPTYFLGGRMGFRSGLFKLASKFRAQVTPFVTDPDNVVSLGLSAGPGEPPEVAAQACASHFSNFLSKSPERWLHWPTVPMALSPGNMHSNHPAVDTTPWPRYVLAENADSTSGIALDPRSGRLFVVEDKAALSAR